MNQMQERRKDIKNTVEVARNIGEFLILFIPGELLRNTTVAFVFQLPPCLTGSRSPRGRMAPPNARDLNMYNAYYIIIPPKIVYPKLPHRCWGNTPIVEREQ